MSGTSMATPHVAGYVAYLLGLDSSLTPASIDSTIKSNALAGILTGICEYYVPCVGTILIIFPSLRHRQPPPQQRSLYVEGLYQRNIYPFI